MPRVRHHSITTKLTRMNMLVSGAALLLACAAFITYDLVSFREGMVYNLSIQAQVAGSNSVSALLFSDPHSAENTLSALKVAPISYRPASTRWTADLSPPIARWRQRKSQTASLPSGSRPTGSRMVNSSWHT